MELHVSCLFQQSVEEETGQAAASTTSSAVVAGLRCDPRLVQGWRVVELELPLCVWSFVTAVLESE